jgi:hypothetical protein
LARVVKLVLWYGGPICGALSLLFYLLELFFAVFFFLGFLNDLLCGNEWLFCGRKTVLGGVPT